MFWAFRKVLEEIFSRVITIENVNEIRFFCTQPTKIITCCRANAFGWYRHHKQPHLCSTQRCTIYLLCHTRVEPELTHPIGPVSGTTTLGRSWAGLNQKWAQQQHDKRRSGLFDRSVCSRASRCETCRTASYQHYSWCCATCVSSTSPQRSDHWRHPCFKSIKGSTNGRAWN